MTTINYSPDIVEKPGTFFVLVDKKLIASSLPSVWQKTFAAGLSTGDLDKNFGDVFCAGLLPVKTGYQKLIFVNIGDLAKFDPAKIKSLGGRLYQKIGSPKDRAISVWFDKKTPDQVVYKFAEGLLLRNYFDTPLKTGDAAKKLANKVFAKLVLPGHATAQLKTSLKQLLAVTEGVFLARDLVAQPPILLTPAELANQAKKIATKFGTRLQIKVLNRAEIEKAKMGLLLAVNRGSHHEPRLITLTLNPKASGQPIVLVGKGVTFDSGGYNIKPTGHMETMHTDMAGAAAVLGAIQALAELGEKKKIIGVIPATENLISGLAYKPSDIITSMSGKTVEIGNTDAEGRLILADAITYAKKHFNPKLIIDLATLTGACIIALGERYAGLFGNDSRAIKALQDASQDSGEQLWHLPLDDNFMDKMKGKLADISNTAHGSPGAGASTGAAFIGHFVEKTPWVHIDIAGPSHQTKDPDSWAPPSGVTGFGVALLVNLIQKHLK